MRSTKVTEMVWADIGVPDLATPSGRYPRHPLPEH
jgi:hypothetical protein